MVVDNLFIVCGDLTMNKNDRIKNGTSLYTFGTKLNIKF